jgi:GTP cyclohydrolase I
MKRAGSGIKVGEYLGKCISNIGQLFGVKLGKRGIGVSLGFESIHFCMVWRCYKCTDVVVETENFVGVRLTE